MFAFLIIGNKLGEPLVRKMTILDSASLVDKFVIPEEGFSETYQSSYLKK